MSGEESERESPNLKLVFDLDEQHKVAALKKFYGIKANADLVRFLISKDWKELPQGAHQP